MTTSNRDRLKANTPLGSELCLTCGVCCCGIFFYNDIDPEDYKCRPEPENPLFPMACRLYNEKENRCVIHARPDRPLQCKTFQCPILKSLIRGEEDLISSKQKIDNIKALLNSVALRLSKPKEKKPLMVLIKTEHDALKSEIKSGDRSRLGFYMDILWLSILMKRYILPLW